MVHEQRDQLINQVRTVVKNRTSRKRTKHMRDTEERSITVTTYAHLERAALAFDALPGPVFK